MMKQAIVLTRFERHGQCLMPFRRFMLRMAMFGFIALVLDAAVLADLLIEDLHRWAAPDHPVKITRRPLMSEAAVDL